MIEATLFVQISYAIGASFIVFGIPNLLALGFIVWITKRIERS